MKILFFALVLFLHFFEKKQNNVQLNKKSYFISLCAFHIRVETPSMH